MFLVEIDNYLDCVYFHVFNYVELVFVIVALIIISVSLRVFTTSPQFHPHLITLMVNLAIEGYLVNIARLIIILICIWSPNAAWDKSNGFYRTISAIDWFHFVPCAAGICTLPAVIAERLSATARLSDYESHRNWPILFTGVFLQYLIGSYVTYTVYKDAVNLLIWMSTGVVVIAGCGLVFVMLNRVNQHRYRMSKSVGASYTLSERFQLAENIKTAVIMKRCCFMGTVMNIVGCGISGGLYWFRDSALLTQVFYCLFNVCTCFYSITFPILGMTSHGVWKGKFFSTFFVFTRLAARHKVYSNTDKRLLQLKSADGRRMTFAVHEQRELYFDSLTKSWS